MLELICNILTAKKLGINKIYLNKIKNKSFHVGTNYYIVYIVKYL